MLALLEQAYKTAKDLKKSDAITSVLLQGVEHLPLPANIGVVSEGLLFAGDLTERARWVP